MSWTSRSALADITSFHRRADLWRIWEAKQKTIAQVNHGIAEAHHVADRVLVMHWLPAIIQEAVNIDLSRPGDRVTRRSKIFEFSAITSRERCSRVRVVL